ncbi:hypothetical protein [Limnobacter sp.]|uniref:hypothetical protein n=1 Tax=Limnobacter sp. TaxID=2003368 RepID=UPI00311F1FBC
MILHFTASKDTYITNKIVSSKYRATDSNVGHASTLDLFKLYDESKIEGEDTPIELSRILIKFPLSEISSSLKDKVSFDDSSLNIKLEMFDVQGTHVAPENFKVVVYPLSMSFDEGIGTDLYAFNDLDRANWITSSYSAGNITWNIAGAKSSGSLNSSDLDVISSGSIASGDLINLTGEQIFSSGREDLSIDITTIASASMCGFIPDHGFLIAFSGSQEWDSETRFVKRFSSRHTKNPYLRPRISVAYDDYLIDSSNMFEFNVTGSLYLRTYRGNSPFNILSGSSNTEVTGSDCLKIIISTGSFAITESVSQIIQTGYSRTGIYSASFAIDAYSSSTVNNSNTLQQCAFASSSITFDVGWYDNSQQVKYASQNIQVKRQDTINDFSRRDIRITLVDLRSTYVSSYPARVRLFVRDRNQVNEPVKRPISLPSKVFDMAYYRIKDADNGKIVVPINKNATRLSTDNQGMYFDLPVSLLPHGRTYTIDILINDRGAETIHETHSRFRVDK